MKVACLMPPSNADQYFVFHELSGTQDGPFNRKQAHQLIFKRKIKRGSKIAIAGREGFYNAKDLFAKAFEAADQRHAEEAAAAKEEKRNAKAAAKEERAASKVARQESESETPPNLLPASNPWKSPEKSKVREDEKEKYWGFAFQKSVISVSIIFVILGGLISLFLAAVVFFNTNGSVPMGLRLLVLVSQMGAAVLATFFVVGSLLFFRNLIDWMIDVERNTRQ